MEPLIAAGFVWSLTKPVLTKYANDYATGHVKKYVTSLLDNGAKNIYKRITDRIDEPTNHHIQRAIRKSYLQATYMAVKFVLKDFNALNILNKDKKDLKAIEVYLHEEIENTAKDGKYLPNTVLDDKYQEILFPKEGNEEKLSELIAHLKLAIISELEKRDYTVPDKLKEVINSGWEVDNKHHDFYALIAAFFTQELKDNPNVSVYLQTEYLDHLSQDTKELKIEFADIKIQLDKHYETYKAILPKLDELLSGQQEIKEEIAGLRDEVMKKIDEAIAQKHIGSFKEVTLSTEYQSKVKVIEDFDVEIQSLQSQVNSLEEVVKNDAAMQATLQQTIKHLNKQIFEKFEARKKEEDAFNEFVTQIINLAQQLNQTKAFDSARLEKARALFAAGKFTEIDSVLNETEIDKDIEAFGAEGKILSNEIIIKAQAIVVNKAEGWFEEADRLYAKAMRIIKNYNTTYSYADFLRKHKQYNKAVEVFEKALTYVSNEVEKAIVLRHLAFLFRLNRKYAAAEIPYIEALTIRRQLAEVNPQKHLPDAALSLHGLACLKMEIREYDAAEKSFIEALTIRRQLAETYPENHLSDVAKTTHLLAVLLVYKKEYKSAKKTLLEGLKIYRKLAESNPQSHLRGVAYILNDLAFTLHEKKEYEAAKKHFLEALTIFRKLAKVNPYRYLRTLSMNLCNLGTFQHEIKEFTTAEENYVESLTIRRELYEINPQIYLTDVADALYKLAILQRDKNEFDSAEKNFLEAVAIIRKLAEVNPKTYALDLALALIELAILQSRKGAFEVAEKSLLEALKICRQLVENYEETYLPDLAKTLYNLGNLQRAENEFGQAQKSYNEALNIQRALVKTRRQTYLPELAKTLNSMGNLHKDKQEIEQAKQSYNEALIIQRGLVETHQQAYSPFLAEILNNLGTMQMDKNEIEQAQQSLNEALSIRKQLAKTHPEFYLPALADTKISFGKFYFIAVKDKAKSIFFINEAIHNLQSFKHLAYIQNKLQKAYNVLGDWEIDVEEYLKDRDAEVKLVQM